ncbi:transcription factor bHLH144-like [Rutidosis leptorrhynchoides]|uniref:transcription factor bHLH144-like n=1 Tax=Rutidosis leptorrhynchoides TaxID=125765 RepID=UPI003A9A532C
MQGDQHNFLRNGDQMANEYIPDHHMSSFFGQNVDFQPSWDCPRNFVIFDRTDNRSQIMYNPNLNVGGPYFNDTTPMHKDVNTSMVMKEDSADIDALLSFDEEDDDDDDDDEVSTARTFGNDISDTSDSCSSRLKYSGPGSTSCNESKCSDRKREKMRKMVKSLRHIVRTDNRQMNTAEVLDEAVKYLKSLKVEAQKMGVGHLSG